MAKLWFAFIAIAVASIPVRASHAQVFPPGTFVIDGYPVSCGGAPTVLIPSLPDAAMNNGQAIAINPIVVQQLPTVLKLFTYAHECGHFFSGADELGADCWAIRIGRDQGWFPPEAFQFLIQLFQGNPGNINHPPGPIRIQNMLNCYQTQ